MCDAFDFLNRNVGALSLIFSAAVMVSTVAYALLTASLVRETRAMRRAETEPALVTYLTPYKRWINFFELIIHNQGRGVARNISWAVTPSLDILTAHGVELGSLALLKGLSQLVPGQQIRCYFGSAADLLKEPPLPAVHITARYETATGERLVSGFVLDIAQYSGIRKLGTQPEEDAVKALADIAKAVSAVVSRGRVSVTVATDEEVERRERERREAMVRRPGEV